MPKLKRPSKTKTAEAESPVGTREIPAHLPAARASLKKTIDYLRHQAASDYICDPDNHGPHWHHAREDRAYSQSVTLTNFLHWYDRDKWKARRDAFWEDVEARVRDNEKDRIVERRRRALEFFDTTLDFMSTYLVPLKDEKGALLLTAKGLPTFPLELPAMDKYVKMFLELHERAMVMSGEVTKRSEQLRTTVDGTPIDEDGAGPLNRHLKTPTITAKLSREDNRVMARALIRAREERVVETTGEGSDDPSEHT